MWIEHYVPQSVKPDLADSYANCFYSCLFCNQARSNKIVPGLLNPCRVSWGDHFTVKNFELQPRTLDAEHTEQTYDVNEPRRLKLRRHRDAAISEAVEVLEHGPSLLVRLLALSRDVPWRDRSTVLEAAHDTRRSLLSAIEQLHRFLAIPETAPTECRCVDGDRVLPPFLEGQVVERTTSIQPDFR